MMTATPKQVSKPVSKVASNHNQFEGLELFDTLGEGTYAKVKLGITSNGDKYAVKVVNIRHKNLQPSEVVPTAGTPQQIFDMVKKEICIHKNMKHKHIIQFHAYKQIESKIYLLLEYAAGGELFDKIEPDCGVDEDLAHVYFKQLISSVEYLHAMGVAHRDIKPENILLDDHNNFKISDFGLSTVFRNKGKERLLQRRCGTFPYIAPEVYNELEYKAQPADIWSCGVVLITLLAGCLPWDEPSEQCSDFRNWRLGSVNMENQYPWSNMSVSARDLMKGILTVDPAQRITIDQIKQHPWVARETSLTRQCNEEGLFVPDLMPVDQYMQYLNIQSPPRSKIKLSDRRTGDNYIEDFNSSQPLPYTAQVGSLAAGVEAGIFMSQPLRTDDMLLSQNDGLSQFSQTQNRQRKLIRRMTRFMSRASPSALQDRLCTYFEGMRYKCDRGPSYQLSISLPNVGKKMPLRFAVRLYPMPLGVYLVEFRLAKGDGLQFKRLFKQTKETLTDLVAADIDCAKTWLNPMIDLGPGNFVPIFKKK